MRARWRDSTRIGAAILAALLLAVAYAAVQRVEPPLAEQALREYAGVYEWEPNRFVYLQLWNEFTGFDKPGQLVAFDESGDIRVLHPEERDRFFTGAGAGLATPVESRVHFVRDPAARIVSLVWNREDSPPRTARRVDAELRETVRFANGDVRLTGTLIAPRGRSPRPAIVLVHGSGAEDREYILPFARFLVRHGIAVLGYDKRGVGESTGDWKQASFDDLAGDVAAAVEYLRTRSDVDPARIGLLGVSQGGWIMPLAAARVNDLAFLVSVSGAAVTPAETTLDQAQNEMAARGMKPRTVADIISVMKLQYAFARTNRGWDDYAAARARLATRLGPPPDTVPATPDHPYWDTIRRSYFYDPAPALGRLRVPVLALFGALDTNILAEKNKAAWEAALKAGGHTDYTCRILPRANHLLWEAAAGTTAEMPSLRRFVPEYFTVVRQWLTDRGGLEPAR